MLKTYIIVRGDLSKSQQAVQAGHALAELVLTYGQYVADDDDFLKWIEQDKTLIILKTHNKEHFDFIYNKILNENLKYKIFKEPDLNNEITAIAIYPQLSKPLCLNELALT